MFREMKSCIEIEEINSSPTLVIRKFCLELEM